jgi:hypothetical protein
MHTPHSPQLRRLAATAAALGFAVLSSGCGNAGEDRVLTIQSTGRVDGLVYLDRDGNGAPNFADTVLPGVGIRLVAAGTIDTVARATTDAQGGFLMSGVLVGHYILVVDTATVGDSVQVLRIDSSAVGLTRADSTETVEVTIGFPKVTIAQARLLPVGTKAFIEGVALTREVCAAGICSFTFADSTLHIADSTGAIRATRVKNISPASISLGDSVRLLATRAFDPFGPATWDGGKPVNFTAVFPPAPSPSVVTNAQARTANSGVLDAGLVRINNDTILDTARVVIGSDSLFQLTTFDGTDTLRVLLDSTHAIPGGFSVFAPGQIKRFDGVLIPLSAGVWYLKPRQASDIAP